MPNYRFCNECGFEHDEFGRTREENEAVEQQQAIEAAKPKSQMLREQLERAKLVASRSKGDDPTLTLGYVTQVAVNPTPIVLRLQRQFTALASQPQAVKDPTTGATTFTDVGDSIAAALRMACDAVYAVDGAVDKKEEIRTLVLQVLDKVHEHFVTNKARIDRQLAQQKRMMEGLLNILTVEMEEAIEAEEAKEALKAAEVPLPKTEPVQEKAPQVQTPQPTRELSAVDKAAAKKAEEALLGALARHQKGKAH